jgi:hypothetical protein
LKKSKGYEEQFLSKSNFDLRSCFALGVSDVVKT